MKNKSSSKSIAKLIMVASLIMGLGTIIVLLGFLGKMKNEVVLDDEAVSGKVIIQDDAVGWKIYRNEEYGFEVKYPQNWNEKEAPYDGTGIMLINTNKEVIMGGMAPDDYFLFDNRINPKYSNDWMGVQIDIYIKPENFSWDNWIKNNFPVVENYENYKYEELEGIKVTELKGLFRGEPNIFLEGEKLYNIRLFNEYSYNFDRDPQKDNLALSYFNQILSAFKFIEKDETVDWKTYRNEEYGFEIKYPELLNDPEEEAIDKPYFFKINFQIPCYTSINEISEEEKEYRLSDEFIANIEGEIKYESGRRFLKVGVAENPFNLSIKEWFKKYLELRYEGLGNLKSDLEEYQLQEIILANVKGEEIYIRALPPIAGGCQTMYFLKNLQIYSIEDCQYEAFLYPATCYGIDTILSSFKFIEEEDTEKIQLYYYNSNYDPKFDCLISAVVPVEREIPKTESSIQDAINLLIKGEITAEEKLAGFMSEFPYSNFKLLDTNLENGVLTLSFTEIPGFTTGGSCRIGILSAQIIKTAEQFNEVEKVIFSPVELFQS